MGWLSSLGAPATPRRRAATAFPGAQMTRLTSSWTQDPGAINRWLRYELRTLRARSRDLARGDAYGKRFISACVNNIAGPDPFRLQSKIRFANGKLNASANKDIEGGYREWSKPGGCEITGKLSLRELDRLTIRCLARDGEVLIRSLRGKQFGVGGQLQLLDIDRLDDQRNEALANGNTIKMGVELDPFSKPVRYHLFRQHPGELGEWNRGSPRDYDIVPADQIRHIFIPDWPEQVRGIPWMHAAMLRLWHLGAFEEAAVVNARVGAAKLAVLQQTNPDDAATLATGRDSAGNLLTDIEPGQFWTLPQGVSLGSWNPQFPDQSTGPFVQACLRGAAAAVGMAYHSLANDPGEVNYSTARVALLDERDMWSTIQGWYIEHMAAPRFSDWMRQMTLAGAFPTAYLKYRDDVRFQGKTWDWIDPEKEVNAKREAINLKIKSRTRVIAEDGEDIEDVFDEIAEEEAMAKEKGVKLEPAAPAAAKPAPTPQPAADEAATAAAEDKGVGPLRVIQ